MTGLEQYASKKVLLALSDESIRRRMMLNVAARRLAKALIEPLWLYVTQTDERPKFGREIGPFTLVVNRPRSGGIKIWHSSKVHRLTMLEVIAWLESRRVKKNSGTAERKPMKRKPPHELYDHESIRAMVEDNTQMRIRDSNYHISTPFLVELYEEPGTVVWAVELIGKGIFIYWDDRFLSEQYSWDHKGDARQLSLLEMIAWLESMS